MSSVSTSELPASPQRSARHGRWLPAMPATADIRALPIPFVFSIARLDAATGIVDIKNATTHMRVYFRDGAPVFMQSNLPGRDVGSFMLSRGRITQREYAQCQEYMQANSSTMQRALRDLRLASDEELAHAYRMLAAEILPTSFGVDHGSFEWRSTDAFVGRIPEVAGNSVQLLFEGLLRHFHPPQVHRFFRGREGAPIFKTALFDTLGANFRAVFGTNVLSQIDGLSCYRSFVDQPGVDIVQTTAALYALVVSGMAVVRAPDPRVDVRLQADRILGAERIADPSRHGPLTDPEKQSRQMLCDALERVAAHDFFGLLQQPRTQQLDREVLKRIYLELTHRFRHDRFEFQRLGNARQGLDGLFEALTEAFETLFDPERRARYLAYRLGGAGASVRHNEERAAILVQHALRDIGARRYGDARRALEQSIQVDPTSAVAAAHLGWLSFLEGRETSANVLQAVQLLKRATTIDPKNAVAYDYLGQICLHKGQRDGARTWFSKCLALDPECTSALRGMRLVDD